VAFAFLALYRDNSYERYDFYIVIFPIIGYVFYQGNLVWHTGKFRINAGRIILYVTCACFMFTAAVFFYRYNSFSNVYRISQNHPGDFNAYFYSTSDLNTLNQYIALRLMDVHPIQIVVTEPPILPPDATDNRYMLPFKVVTPELLNEIAKQEDIFISEALLNWMKQAKERH
ncbi:MAG: hypothetical protein KDK27_07985, partial [Leptospiraceae bacterium]|nr:hypothetical protein [Leptospiraceae bacterium]